MVTPPPDRNGLDGYGLDFVRCISVHEPESRLLAAVRVEIQFVAVGQVSGVDMIAQRHSGDFAIANQHELVEGHFPHGVIRELIEVGLNSGQRRELQFAALSLICRHYR
ncbi:hypothetical protein [Gulosibacter molinativorax]|uniref:hypothetical protein n=1 Tax=Gulosibacter molinativorax TaxID=256821 RepID=UPI00047AF509|nr:hypothetical protein [Gulosibacter molinativorax]